MKSTAVSSGAVVRAVVPVLLFGAVGGVALWTAVPRGNVLTDELSVPLDGAKAAKVDIDTGSGNLTIDLLGAGEPLLTQVLASGTLQYRPNQGLPGRSVSSVDGRVTVTLKGGADRQPRFHLPWTSSNGATEWQIHLNPAVPSEITARTGGGNVKLKLSGMIVPRLWADSGGGNLDVVLPENARDLSIDARTGGGNVTVEIGSGTAGSNTVNASSGAGKVTVRVPSSLAARIHASSGMGKVVVDSRFSKIDEKTYESPDYESAANRIEITVHSGAGNVTVGQ